MIVERDAQPVHESAERSSEAAPSSDPPREFVPVTRGAGSCKVTLVALLEAEEYRGAGPMTPFLEAAMNADPDFARSWESEGYGDHHIQCHYEVRIESQPQQRYRWRVVYGNTLREHTPEICKTELAAVAKDIVETTQNCTQPSAGAYWGYSLDPI